MAKVKEKKIVINSNNYSHTGHWPSPALATTQTFENYTKIIYC